MRVYLPATSTQLRELLTTGQFGRPPLTGFAVTPGLREWYLDDDVEELEYAASSEAARACLRLLQADQSAARRRIVLAVDVPDAAVAVHDDIDRGVIRLVQPVVLANIAALHVDDADAQDAVRAAADAILRADLGNQSAQDAVDDAEAFELAWYANQEIASVLNGL